MANLKLLVSLGSAISLLVAPVSAEARFGKHGSSSGSSSSSGNSGGSHSSTPGGSYGVPSYRGSYYYRPNYYGWPGYYSGWGFYPYFGFYSPYYYSPYATPNEYPYSDASVSRAGPSPDIKATLGAEGQGFTGGGSVGINGGLEGKRFGVNAQFTSIFLNADPGTIGSDSIKLFNIYATYALIAHERGRLRVEGGLTSAFAPDLTVAGPGVGFSGIVKLLGPLGAEGAVHVTPFPYHQLDWNVGLALGLGPLGLRGGWRRIWLDDNGLVDAGVSHQDVFNGPYLGLALVF